MLSCYSSDPDEATTQLIAEELLRRHTKELSEGETLHEKASVKVFTQFLKKNAYNKDVAYAQWREFIR